MPRSKFATKNYGPTKPAICENQHLPPGTLPKGPGEHNAVYFFLVLANTGGFLYPVAGSTVLTRTADPNEYAGLATVGDFTVAITLNAAPPDYGPWFHWTVRKFGIWLFASSIFADTPRSIDPYDTGILLIGGNGPVGQEMIRAVATD